MAAGNLLLQATILLAAVVAGVPLLKRLGLSPVIGYIAAGASIGPWGFQLVADLEAVRALAEIGIVLLLFLIGLELQPARLWDMRRAVFGLGAAQVAATGVLFALAAWLLGMTAASASIVGFGLALSSTAIGLQILIERRQLALPQGRAGFAVLLFQDLAVIPLLAVLPALVEGTPDAAPPSHLAPWLAVPLFVAVFAAGRYLLRPYFRRLAATESQEVFTAGTLLVVLAVGLFMHELGVSMALGAFVAGLLLADSEYRHAIEADIQPFKGLLLGLFFMVVGMSVNAGLLASEPVAILAIVVAVVACKALLVYGLARAFGEQRASAYAVAIVLSQGGEFAFVLFALAAAEGILPQPIADRLVVAVTLSMLTTPLLASWLKCLPGDPKTTPTGSEMPPDTHPVLIAGFGRFGQIVARILATRGIGFVALDKDIAQLEFVTRFGEKLYFGDAARLDILRASRADEASVLVIAIDDVDESIKCAQIAQTHFPHLKIYARARNRLHAYRLLDLGIRNVWRETFHSSVDMAGAVLAQLGLPESAAEETVRIFTLHDERMLRRAAAHHADTDKLIELARAGRTELHSLFEQDRR